MRKYLLGISALIAGIALNAFTPVKKSSAKPLSQGFIWYFIQGNNQIDPSMPINPGDPVNEADLETYYFACYGSGWACARGYRPNELPMYPYEAGVIDVEKW